MRKLADLSARQRSIRGWSYRQCAKEMADRPSASSCCHRAISPGGSARSLLAKADCVPDSVVACQEVVPGDIVRRRIRCTLREGSAAPTPACCCAPLLPWLPHPVPDDRRCNQTDQGCAGSPGACDTVASRHRQDSLPSARHGNSYSDL